MRFKRLVSASTRRTYLFVSVFTFLTLGCIYVAVIPIEFGHNNNMEMDSLQRSDTTTLYYMEYVALTAKNVGSDGSIYWEFLGTNTNVGIKVFIMDPENWEIFIVDYPSAYGYLVSDGSYYGDYGTWIPTKKDTWHVAFINMDPVEQSTTLTYSITCNGCTSKKEPNIGLIIGIALGIIIPVGAIAGFLVYRSRKKKREVPIIPKVPKTPEVIPEEKPIITEPVEPGAIFCTKCGAKVVDNYCTECGAQKYEFDRTKVIENIQKVFESSGIRIDLEMLRDILPMDASEFNSKIFDLADRFGFKIELEMLHITEEKKGDFITALIKALSE